MLHVNKISIIVTYAFSYCFLGSSEINAQTFREDSLMLNYICKLSESENLAIEVGAMFLEVNSPKEAREYVINKIKEIDKLPVSVFIGDCYFYENNIDSAMNYYHSALMKLHGRLIFMYDKNIHERLGDCFYYKGDFENALAHYIKSSMHPKSHNDPKHYFKLAITNQKLKKYHQSIAAYNNLLFLDPGAVDIWERVNNLRTVVKNEDSLRINLNYLYVGLTDSCINFFYDSVLPLGNPETWVKAGVSKNKVTQYYDVYMKMSQMLPARFSAAKSWYIYYATHTASRFGFIRNIMGVSEQLAQYAKNNIHTHTHIDKSSEEKNIAYKGRIDTIENKSQTWKDDLELSLYYYSLWGSATSGKEDSSYIKLCYKSISENFYYLNDLLASINYLSKGAKIKQFKNTDRISKESDYDMLLRILKKSFEDVSFDINTNQIRSWEIDDFSGPLVVDLDSSQTLDKKPHTIHAHLHPKAYKDYKCYPYGITHPEEDWINTSTELGIQVDNVRWYFLKKNQQDSLIALKGALGDNSKIEYLLNMEKFSNREKYLITLMDNKDFELALKDLLFRIHDLVESRNIYLKGKLDIEYCIFKYQTFMDLFEVVKNNFFLFEDLPDHIINNFSILLEATRLSPIALDTLISYKLKEESKINGIDTSAERKTFYYNMLDFLDTLDVKFPQDPIIHFQKARVIGKISWGLLLSKDIEKSLKFSTKGIELDSTQEKLLINKAHALLLLDKHEESLTIYNKLTNHKIDTYGEETYREVILEDLNYLKKIFINLPEVQKIDKVIIYLKNKNNK